MVPHRGRNKEKVKRTFAEGLGKQGRGRCIGTYT